MLDALRAAAVLVIAACGACGSGSQGPALTFDPCDPVLLGAASLTDEQHASLDEALALWSAAGVTTFSVGDAAQVTVRFTTGAAVLYGFYDDTTATVWVNSDITDPTQRAIVLAHELGHSLGLVHVPVATRLSVMNPGNLTVSPTPDDAVALVGLWGTCTH
jgi:hypothetical protein